MSVAVLRGDSVLLARGYGFANLEYRIPATTALLRHRRATELFQDLVETTERILGRSPAPNVSASPRPAEPSRSSFGL
jgi:hypothetical protein